jgi:hypothetical protein
MRHKLVLGAEKTAVNMLRQPGQGNRAGTTRLLALS